MGVLNHASERKELPAVIFGRTNPRCWNATLGHPSFTARPQTGRPRSPAAARPALGLAEYGNVRAVAVGGMNPAVLVVIGHAPLRERLHLLEGAGGLRVLQREYTHQLVAAGVVHLVEFVTRAEFGTHRIPQHLHDLDALLVVDAVGAADVARKVLVDVGVLE